MLTGHRKFPPKTGQVIKQKFAVDKSILDKRYSKKKKERKKIFKKDPQWLSSGKPSFSLL